MSEQSKSAFKVFLRPVNKMLHNFRLRLAHTEALPQLAILGILSGFATGLVAVVFRLGMEWPLQLTLPGSDSEGFESLPLQTRMLLPLVGALLIGIIFHFNSKQVRDGGVGHVIERYHRHQAHLPLKNAVLQFVGSIIAVISGYSVGREGPAVHLGAASSSFLGQAFKLPNNSLRILVGCGVASAIAASFNTPLAGVIFAMEVVLMEYTVAGFIPIILAAVCGAVTSRICFGDSPAFDIPALNMLSLLELPFLALCGVIVGLAGTIMILMHRYLAQLSNVSVSIRIIFASLLMSGAAALVPQVMGIGYDTLEQALLGNLEFTLLATIVIAKLLVSTTVIALGIPGGSIGPTLVIGACLGGCLGVIGSSMVPPGQAADSGFYAVVCMGAMMACVLNAPLAALIVLLELTYNPNILMPGMLVIVVSCITTRVVSRAPGLFLMGLDIRQYSSPVSQALNREGVTSVMTQNYVRHTRYLAIGEAEQLLHTRPEWLLIEDPDNDKHILRAVDLSRYLLSLDQEQTDSGSALASEPESESGQIIDLLQIPAERWQLFPIHRQATLYEAMALIRQKNAYALYVEQAAPYLISEVAGIITQERIDNFYR
jgi:CIC family chloride channel protein